MPPHAQPETATPTSESELAQVLSDAQRRGLKVVPRGGGTKSDWGNPPERTDVVLSTLGLGRVLEHAAGDMTVTVEAGCKISSLQQVVAQRGQRLALDPLWPDRATVGGVLATNDSGTLRHAFGSPRDLLLGVTVALPDGTLARSGGKVVKNVAGYDLPKLMAGAYGSLGVVTSATFRLHPVPRATRQLQFNVSWEAIDPFVQAVREAPLMTTGLQLVVNPGMAAGVDVRVEGSPEGVASAADAIAAFARVRRATPLDPPGRTTSEREALWVNPGPLAKVTFPPAAAGRVCRAVRDISAFMVAEAVGAGLVVFQTSDEAGAPGLARDITALDGTLILLRGEPALKRRLNDAAMAGCLPLMRRVKHEFDPLGTLNPGVMAGGV